MDKVFHPFFKSYWSNYPHTFTLFTSLQYSSRDLANSYTNSDEKFQAAIQRSIKSK